MILHLMSPSINLFSRVRLGKVGCYWVFAFLMCCLAQADTLNLGVFSFDPLTLPGPGSPGKNNFTIFDFTFDSALPPDFPVLSSVKFENASVILTDSTGPQAPLLLGDFSPGASIPVTLEFLDTQAFFSAELRATLDPLSLQLADGSTFLADSSILDAIISPISGPTLVAGTDFQLITVNGSIAAVPEPGSWLLLLSVVILVVAVLRNNARGHRRQS